VRVSILERVASAGGQARIDTAPGEGTLVSLSWDGAAPAEPERVPDDVEEPV
jgi:hypothetical protein